MARRSNGRPKRMKIPLAATIGGAFTLLRIKETYDYLKTASYSSPTGTKFYTRGEAFIGAIAPIRIRAPTTVTPKSWMIVNSSTANPYGDLVPELISTYAPAAIGIGASKFVGGNGMMGIPGLNVNRMIPLPFVKI